MSRARFWLLAVLLFVYLAGILLLSAVTLHEPKNRASNNKVDSILFHFVYVPSNSIVLQVFEHGGQISRAKTFEYGVPGLRPPLRRSRIQWCAELRYLDPPQQPVALASFPGSGNTWLRYLLQQATGKLVATRVKNKRK